MAVSDEAMRRAHLAVQRFGLGARPGQLEQIAADPRTALRAEIGDTTRCFIADAALPTSQAAVAQSIAQQEATRLASQASRDDQREMRVAAARSGGGQTAAGMEGGGMMGGNAMAPPRMAAAGMAAPAMAGGMQAGGMAGAPQARAPAPVAIEQQIFRQEAMARVQHGTAATLGFAERLALFWSNHFCVAASKAQIVRATAGAMEREAIRPHVLGRFSDMLLAVAKHPAMLVYLDNRQSIGPNSRAGRGRKLGLNENLAREILELHTLGVDGGYTQEDVTSLARIITGWTFVGANERLGPVGSFVFVQNRHEPGAQTLLGKAYPDTGVEQGEAALRDLARHPATAGHIARKLARHFHSDDPPRALVERLARRFRETDGDLQQVAWQLTEAPEMWRPPLTKVRSPYEFMVGVARAGVPPKDFGQLVGPLNAMGQPLYAPPGPNGWPDRFEDWAAPDAWRTRLDVAAAVGRRMGGAINPSELADSLFGPTLSAETRQAIARAESKPQGTAILLMSPEFNRR
jgi:uncharacterized protein (DUF1800 family)